MPFLAHAGDLGKIESPASTVGNAPNCAARATVHAIVVEAVSEDDYKVWWTSKKAKLASAAASAEKQWSQDDLMSWRRGVAKQCVVATSQRPRLPRLSPGWLAAADHGPSWMLADT